MAIGSWHRDPAQQQAVQTRVSVSEQRTPEFALRFDFELLQSQQLPSSGVQQNNWPPERLTRLVTQRQMLQAFEFAFARTEAKRRRRPSDEDDDEAVTMAEDLDKRESKEQHGKVQQLAAVRHSQLLKDTARILRMNEQKRRDSREVRQMIADTLEYREELHAMEFRVKQASIAAHRDQERVKRATRVALGSTLRGSVEIGSGPPSRQEMELMYGKTRDEKGVYDLHGRRRDDGEAGQVAKETTLESAMRKVRRLVLNSVDSVDIFRQYDLDRSGTLSYTEFQSMMRDNGTGNKAELSREQSAALFKHFDADDSGEVDYVELLWGFFNQEAFLKRWRERKGTNTKVTTSQDVRDLFRRRDRAGRAMLPLTEFQLVMENLGVSLKDVDAKLLSVKFDAGKDGCIDYLAFLDFVNRSGTFELQQNPRLRESDCSTQSSVHSSQKSITTSHNMDHILMELQELTATQEKFRRLLRK
ncbi:hypothetical protein BBJ29_002469 [Phytophthora kernoviae]|uniref:EF-hand domain-containing protein n=1 Tax=Phytophthora kernoviae TaxID=325452 RepID=A0A3F2RYL8_9STRA|nr:hypothetical protein BBJ29_002469 [Phytophthora kernoviae]RLN66832.1 hypothetical protein BBP00_00001987 [Phytophthora kernoviae]